MSNESYIYQWIQGLVFRRQLEMYATRAQSSVKTIYHKGNTVFVASYET